MHQHVLESNFTSIVITAISAPLLIAVAVRLDHAGCKRCHKDTQLLVHSSMYYSS